MERYPPCVVRQNETGCDHQFRKIVWINAHVFVSLKIDSMGAQNIDGFGRVHVFPGSQLAKQFIVTGKGRALDVEVKVELPGADIKRKVPFLVRKSQPDLDRLEQVDIAPHRLIMIIRRGLE